MVPTQLSLTAGPSMCVAGRAGLPGKQEWAGFLEEAVFNLTFSGRYDKALLSYSLFFANTGCVSGASMGLMVQGRSRKEVLAVLQLYQDPNLYSCLKF